MTKTAREPDADRLRRAVGRLEQAMAEVAAIAGERAKDHVEAAAQRWLGASLGRGRAEPGSSSAEWESPSAGPTGNSSPARPPREPAWLWSDRPRTGKLRRDGLDGKLFGVCAGIAHYCGLEPWVVRCLAIVGVILFSWVVLVAYAVAVFVMDKDDAQRSPEERYRRGAGRRRRREARRRENRRRQQRFREAVDQTLGMDDGQGRRRRKSPAAATGVPPRQRLREVHGRYDELEHRLRRLESEVTSGRFDLHRELANMADGDRHA